MLWAFYMALVVKNPPAKVGDSDSIPGSGRSPGVGSGNSLQYSCLENPMDGGARWAKSRTRLSNFTSQHFYGIDPFSSTFWDHALLPLFTDIYHQMGADTLSPWDFSNLAGLFFLAPLPYWLTYTAKRWWLLRADSFLMPNTVANRDIHQPRGYRANA